MTRNRLNPSDFATEALDSLSAVLAQPGHIALVDEEGRRAELPAPLAQFLLRVARLMEEQRTLVLIPEDEEFTTQAAANYLGVSRQHLVDLLEGGKIPFHKVGTHRRVYFRDLLAYEKQRDQQRRAALDSLMREIDGAGLYEGSYTGDPE